MSIPLPSPPCRPLPRLAAPRLSRSSLPRRRRSHVELEPMLTKFTQRGLEVIDDPAADEDWPASAPEAIEEHVGGVVEHVKHAGAQRDLPLLHVAPPFHSSPSFPHLSPQS